MKFSLRIDFRGDKEHDCDCLMPKLLWDKYLKLFSEKF